MRRQLSSSILALVLFGSAAAHAQFATPIRYNEGPGVKLTESLVFHPGVAFETRFDNNPLATNDNLQGSAYMRLIAHLDLSTLSPQRLTNGSGEVSRQAFEFRLKSALAYREYLSGEDAVQQQRALEVDAGLLLKYAPSRLIALQLTNDYARQVTARNFQVVPGSGALPDDTLSRNLNRLAASMKLSPGGGRLAIELGYALNLDAFEDEGFYRNNRLFHEIFLRGSYKLLPKTAILVEAIQQFYDYYEVDAIASALDNVSSKPLRVYAGFSGLITPRLSVLAKIGYGNSFYDSNDDFSSVLAKAELGYQIGPTARAKLGYERRFDDSFFGNFFADHIVYAGYDHQIAQRFLLHFNGDYRYRTFDGFPGGVDPLDANMLTLGAGFDYQIKDWVYVGIGYDLQLQDFTEGSTIGGVGTVVGLNDFTRHQVYGKVGVSY
jgi:hypothetical protein